MANPEHLEILNQGVGKCNQWRYGNLSVGLDLSNAGLSGIYIGEADFSKANLSGADLSGAYLFKTNLSETNLSEADLSRASLRGVNLKDANLRGADLTEADLIWANLSGADLCGANLRSADLSGAECYGANLNMADIVMARLINTKLDGATLTGARLWETQRAGWSIKNVICEYIYWAEYEGIILGDKGAKTVYSPGEFERMFGDKIKVKLFYKDGINPLEIATLPALIKHLEESHQGCGLRLVSIHEDSGGVVVELAIDDDSSKSPEQLKQLKREIETTAQRAIEYERKYLAEEKQRLQLEGEVKQLTSVVDKLILRPSINYQGNNMGDTNIVSGQAGAVGQNAHAHDLTFNQIVNHFEKSIDLPTLANQLGELRAEMAKRQDSSPQAAIAQGEAARAEIAAKEGNTSKVVEYLRAGGQVLLDVAKETGKELLTAAIKTSMGMQ